MKGTINYILICRNTNFFCETLDSVKETIEALRTNNFEILKYVPISDEELSYVINIPIDILKGSDK